MRIEDWGLVEYEPAVERQLAAVEEVASGDPEATDETSTANPNSKHSERIIICTHPPVVTLGRATAPEDLTGWNGTTVESSRGGRATYHGPNQIVIYPILDLRRKRAAFKERDIHAYLRAMEAATVVGLREMGLTRAEARTTEVGGISLTGVWIGDHKIASMGIAVRKWITYHGVAINILNDPSAFKGIRPCGFAADIMTSAESELGAKVSYNACKDLFAGKFLSAFA